MVEDFIAVVAVDGCSDDEPCGDILEEELVYIVDVFGGAGNVEPIGDRFIDACEFALDFVE